MLWKAAGGDLQTENIIDLCWGYVCYSYSAHVHNLLWFLKQRKRAALFGLINIVLNETPSL